MVLLSADEITQLEAAHSLATSRAGVHNLIRRGELTGTPKGGTKRP